MDQAKSLVESKAFWSALLAFLAIVGKAFNLSQFATWAADPATVDTIMSVVGMAGALGAIAFRASATKQITSVLPPKGTNP